MIRRRLSRYLIPTILIFVLGLWSGLSMAQGIPAQLKLQYRQINQQMAAKVADARALFQGGNIKKGQYQIKLDKITKWRAEKLFEIEMIEFRKGQAKGDAIVKKYQKIRDKLKSDYDANPGTQKEYRRKLEAAEKRFKSLSQRHQRDYADRALNQLKKAAGSKSSLGSGIYATDKNGKIKLDPKSGKPVFNKEFRGALAGGDNDWTTTPVGIKEMERIAKSQGLKIKRSAGTLEIKELALTTNTTSMRERAKSDLKKIAAAKRGIEAKLKTEANPQVRRELLAEKNGFENRERLAKSRLDAPEFGKIGSSGQSTRFQVDLGNAEIYDVVKVKQWGESRPGPTKAMANSVADLYETNDHMNKSVKARSKNASAMTSDDVQSIAKSAKKVLGPSLSGNTAGSLTNNELSKILKKNKWQGSPQEFRKLVADLKSRPNAKDYFYKDNATLDKLKNIVTEVGEKTQAKRIIRVSSEARKVESRAGKAREIASTSKKLSVAQREKLKGAARKLDVFVKEAKLLTRDSMAGSAAFQKSVGLKQPVLTGIDPALRPSTTRIGDIEGIIDPLARKKLRGKLPKSSPRVNKFLKLVGRGSNIAKQGAIKASKGLTTGARRIAESGRKLSTRVGKVGAGAMQKMDMIGTVTELVNQAKKATDESKFSGEKGSREDYLDRASIISKAIFQTGREISGVAQYERDLNAYEKQNKDYYQKNKVGAAYRTYLQLKAEARAGGKFIFDRSPPGMIYNITNGATDALATYTYKKSGAEDRRLAESNYSAKAYRRNIAREMMAKGRMRLNNSPTLQGMREIMLLQREQDAMSRGSFPTDSSRSRAIAKFLVTAEEPRILREKYGEATKLQRLIEGELNDLKVMMNTRRKDGGQFDPTYYQAIESRVGRLKRAMDVSRNLAADLRAEEKSSSTTQKLGTKNTFKLLKSRFKSFNNDLDGMRYRLQTNLYNAQQQKERETLLQKQREVVPPEKDANQSDGAQSGGMIGGFFSGLGKLLRGKTVDEPGPMVNTTTSTSDPIEVLSKLKNTLFDSARDAIGGFFGGTGIDLDIPTPLELGEKRRDDALNIAKADIEFETNAQTRARSEDSDYRDLVDRVRKKERMIAERREKIRREQARKEAETARILDDAMRKLRAEQRTRALRVDQKVKRQQQSGTSGKTRRRTGTLSDFYTDKEIATIGNRSFKSFYCTRASSAVRDAWIKSGGNCRGVKKSRSRSAPRNSGGAVWLTPKQTRQLGNTGKVTTGVSRQGSSGGRGCADKVTGRQSAMSLCSDKLSTSQ